MTDSNEQTASPAAEESFEQQAELPQPGFFREFGEFLLDNKKWWLIPLLLALCLLLLMPILTNSVIAPFMYPL